MSVMMKASAGLEVVAYVCPETENMGPDVHPIRGARSWAIEMTANRFPVGPGEILTQPSVKDMVNLGQLRQQIGGIARILGKAYT